MRKINNPTTILAFALSCFLVVFIPSYWKAYGVQNFLWFSDLALFITTLALWLRSSLLISMLSITVLPFELIWGIDFLMQLLTPYNPFTIADFMFVDTYHLFVRALSLFHLAIAIIFITYLKKWGYNPRAFSISILFGWIVLLATYFLTDPTRNINFVFMPIKYHWPWISQLSWFIFLMIAPIFVVILPMHYLLKKLFLSPLIDFDLQSSELRR